MLRNSDVGAILNFLHIYIQNYRPITPNQINCINDLLWTVLKALAKTSVSPVKNYVYVYNSSAKFKLKTHYKTNNTIYIYTELKQNNTGKEQIYKEMYQQ